MVCSLSRGGRIVTPRTQGEAVPWIGELICYIYFYHCHPQGQGQREAHSKERAKVADGPGRHVVQRLARRSGDYDLGKKELTAGMRAASKYLKGCRAALGARIPQLRGVGLRRAGRT